MQRRNHHLSSVIVTIKPQYINEFIERFIDVAGIEIMPPDNNQGKIVIIIETASENSNNDYVTMIKNSSGVTAVKHISQKVGDELISL